MTDRRQLLGVLVRDLEPELVFQLHDQLDEIERVGIEIFLERRLLRDRALVGTELVDERHLDTLRTPHRGIEPLRNLTVDAGVD